MPQIELRQVDPAGMYGHIRAFPQHLKEGIDIGRSLDLGAVEGKVYRSIVVAGMGGSAIAGDLLLSYLGGELTIPFEVWRDYDLPGHAGRGTLVICSSYSGETAETLSAYAAALKRGCSILVITSGGKLSRSAAEHDNPALIIPPGLPPRAALGYSFAPLLIALGKLGICSDHSDELERVAATLGEIQAGYSIESADNRAREIAGGLHGGTVVIYTGGGLLRAAGVRFKGQICENAKQPAFCNQVPEFNHNELVGWQNHEIVGGAFTVVMLCDGDDHPQVKRRFEIAAELLRRRRIKTIQVESEGGSRLERMLRMVHLVDFVSFYLAVLNKVDPTPVEFINYLKDKLD